VFYFKHVEVSNATGAYEANLRMLLCCCINTGFDFKIPGMNFASIKRRWGTSCAPIMNNKIICIVRLLLYGILMEI